MLQFFYAFAPLLGVGIVDALVDTANTASVQSDRWLLIAVTMCFGAAIYLSAKYQTRQAELKEKFHREEIKELRDQFAALNTSYINYVVNTNGQLMKTLDRTTSVLEKVLKEKAPL